MGDNRGPQVSGVATFFLILTWVFVGLRCYCRISLVKSFGLDDYLALVAQLFFTFFCAFAITGVAYGTGQHTADIQPPSNIPIGLKWWWACEPVYVLSNMALKFSICVFLLRLAVSKIQRAILWAVMGISGIMGTYYFFLFVFQCLPVAYFWGQYTGMEGSCIDPKIIAASTYAYSAISCWSDWTCCIIPTFMVWNLQMNPRTKISVCMILAVSSIASIATIIRIPYVQGLTNVSDFLYATTDVAVWSTCETGLGISASCAATLRPLFRSFFASTRLFGTTRAQGASAPGAWPSARAGYVRNGSNRGNEEEDMSLRTTAGKSAGSTVVEAKGMVDGKGSVDAESGAEREWNSSRTHLTDEEFGFRGDWANGISKTTVVTTTRTKV